MNIKSIVFFVLSVALSVLAASYRFHDSAHAMGVLKRGGATSRHPVVLDGQARSASLIVTARVLPPYRGDARVVLENTPGYSYTIHNSEAVIRLPFHRRPSFDGTTYRDLRPNDKVSLWLVIKPEAAASMEVAPVVPEAGSCCGPPIFPFPDNPGSVGPESTGQNGPRLVFYDTKSNERLLAVPMRFADSGGDRHGH